MISNFEFQDLSNSAEQELALILGRVTHHIHPDIVKYIAEINADYKENFIKISPEKCDLEPFFYAESDCVFPGFRRPINKEKSGTWKNNICQNDGTILNDNTFPRHIWAYLSMNKGYSGGLEGMWTASGLDKFELAHVFAHKQDERTLEVEVFDNVDMSVLPHGLFTSASNVVLIPKGYAKPTDHMKNIKVCFYKRHLELYGNNIIGLGNLDDKHIPSWYNKNMWKDPELPSDWKIKIDNLLAYRVNYLANKYRPPVSGLLSPQLIL
jgi:hypothetical protein